MDNIVIELFLLSIGASFVQRTTGFGFGIFIMTMLPSIMPSYGEATTLSGILAMTTSLIIVIQKYKYITWRRLLPILFTFIIISIGAIFVLKRMEYHILNILLGITLIIVSIYFAFFSKRIKVKTTLGRNAERIDGRIFRNAGSPSRALLRKFRARQGSLSGDDADLFPGRQSDDDFGKSLQWFLHHHGLHRLCVWNSRSLHRQPDRLLGVQAPQRLPAQIHHLCLYRNQRISLPSGGVAYMPVPSSAVC